MSDIKVGDRVVCIDDSGAGNLIKNREYIVYAFKQLKCCGQMLIDVGLMTISGQQCYSCKSDVTPENSTAYFRLGRFRKVEEKVNYVKLEIAIQEPILN